MAGIQAGSFLYWSCESNFQKWIDINTNEDLKIGWRQALRNFVGADASGATAGGLAGSVLPGVGTVSGAVMGGTILSGLEALTW